SVPEAWGPNTRWRALDWPNHRPVAHIHWRPYIRIGDRTLRMGNATTPASTATRGLPGNGQAGAFFVVCLYVPHAAYRPRGNARRRLRTYRLRRRYRHKNRGGNTLAWRNRKPAFADRVDFRSTGSGPYCRGAIPSLCKT